MYYMLNYQMDIRLTEHTAHNVISINTGRNTRNKIVWRIIFKRKLSLA